MGKPVDALRRPPEARRERGGRSSSASGSSSSGSSPGSCTRFIFWGFVVLLPDDPHRDDRRRRPRPELPADRRSAGSSGRAGSRSSSTSSAALVLVGVAVGALDPQGPAARAVRGQSPRRGRPHPRADRRDRDDAPPVARDADRARRSTSGRRPGRRSRTRSPTSSADGDATEVLERVFVWAHVLLILAFLVYLPYSKHLHIATAGLERVLRAHARAWTAGAARLRRPGRRPPLRRGHGRRPDLEADARHDVLHRVRALPGRLPRVRDREGALAEAPDHGSPRPALRRGAEAARGGDVRAEPARPERRHATRSSGTASRAARACTSARSRSSTSTTSSTCAGTS